ncbi:abscission/NoCut checkpoint regulator-like [Oppia nitens]|uniref:abscission/NoCut checkpoint regulator-like n=1 Tax=Oppia nitens TaxID=1686743 RepID=UPI0023DCB496|nr:abscission/NoCut checkpoint regulator-like [Oppia nitens]
MSFNDEEIEERLRRLKSDTSPPTQTTDQKAIEERLARLKGIDPNHYTMPPITVYHHHKHKTDSEKADQLMTQFCEELALNKRSRDSFGNSRRLSTDEDIERRLAKLKDENNESQKQTNMEIDVDLDDTEIEKRLIDRLLAECRLPTVPTLPLDPHILDIDEENIDDIGSDSLPWCQICNEDAVIKCHDCSGDLYCKECFVDFHDDSDLKKHKTEPFRGPKNSLNL